MTITGASADSLSAYTSQFEQSMATALGLTDSSGITATVTSTTDGAQVQWTIVGDYSSELSDPNFQNSLFQAMISFPELAIMFGAGCKKQ